MGVYTKTGDNGQTSLFGGDRVGKDDQRVDTYGTVDEANSMMGLARSFSQNSEVQGTLYQLQKKMFVLGAELATPLEKADTLKERISAQEISNLEKIIDYFESQRTPNHAFVVPGNSQASAALDVARTIVRRAERLAVTLSREEKVSKDTLAYLNRLSDLLFVLARVEEETLLLELIKGKVYRRLAQLKEGEMLNLDLAKKIIEECEKKAKEIGVPMVIAVVDNGGNLVACHRQDDALLVSLDIAINKAYTAVGLKLPTHVAAEVTQPGQSLYGLQNTNQGRIVVFGGGFPLKEGDRVVGAVGVSGGSVEEDMTVAQAGVEFFAKRS